MGSLGSRFGRNVPLEYTVREKDPLEPNPRTGQPRAADARRSSSRRRRSTCSPARGSSSRCTTGSATARTRRRTRGRSPLAADDPWPEHPMQIAADAARPERGRRRAADLRHRRHALVGRLADLRPRSGVRRRRSRTGEDGKLKIDDRGLIPQEIESHVDLTGVAGNFWVGLALLHSLFMREHNAVCDHLHATHPELSDDELYDKARLVVAALMAKIHTVDWTPAIIAHPTTVTALRTNWWGLEGETARQALRPDHVERGDPRHPRLADRAARRPVPADRGVRRRLPHAPADPGRLQLPLARRRRAAAGAHAARRSACCTCASG